MTDISNTIARIRSRLATGNDFVSGDEARAMIAALDQANTVAAQRVSGDPVVRDLLLHYWGTTEPELLRELFEEHAPKLVRPSGASTGPELGGSRE